MSARICIHLLVLFLICQLAMPAAHACTAFVVYRSGLALAGNNEDYWNTDTKMWVVPAAGSKRGTAGKYGRVYFGFNNFFPQGGMNEEGLFFDGFATARNEVEDSRNRPAFPGNMVDHVMANCATVAEVIDVFEQHNLQFLANAMLMFADRNGDSVIIEGDEFLRIEGDWQLVTNFYQSQTAPDQVTCHRFRTAQAALQRGAPVSVEACRDILAATCQRGAAPTQYSNVYDLQKQRVHLYHFQNFDEVVVIDLKQELEQGAAETDLPTLFSAKESFARFQEARAGEIREKTDARRLREIDSLNLEQCAGVYEFDSGQAATVRLEFSRNENRLFVARADETARVEIYPEARDRFFRFGDSGLEVYRFERGSDDQVVSVTLTLKQLDRSFAGQRVN